MSKKFIWLSGIYKADKEVDGEYIKYTGHHIDGSKLAVRYIDGGDVSTVEVKRMDVANRWFGVSITKRDKEESCDIGDRKLNIRIKTYRNVIVKLNTDIQINELIYQFDRLVRGLQVVDGEYNHFYPLAFETETFSVNTGDVVPKSQNNAHWALCLKIFIDTGYKVKAPSYGTQVYALSGKEKIDKRDVELLDRAGLLQIMNK